MTHKSIFMILLLILLSPPSLHGLLANNHRNGPGSPIVINHFPSTNFKNVKSWHYSNLPINQKSAHFHRRRKRTRMTTLHAHASSSSSRIKTLQSTLIPPIPLQEQPRKHFGDHFKPRFIMKEFLYGFQYMCRVHWLLLLCSMMARLVIFKSGLIDYIAIEGILIQLGSLPKSIFYHRLENLGKWLVIKHIKPPSIVFLSILVPTFEEISNRGVAHWLHRFFCRFELWIMGWCSNIPYWMFGLYGGQKVFSLGYLICLFIVRVAETILTITSSNKNPSMILIKNILGWIEYGLFIPAIYQFFVQLGLQAKTKYGYRRRIKWKEICTLDGPPEALSLSKDEGCGETETPQQQKSRSTNDISNNSIIRQSISRSARWHGAYSFGLAHYTTKLPEMVRPPFLMILSAQKAFGTTISSLLIESRLAINRGSLWGCIGAHVAFNSFAGFPLVSNLFFMTTPPVLFGSSIMEVLVTFSIGLAAYRYFLNFVVQTLDRIIKRVS